MVDPDIRSLLDTVFSVPAPWPPDVAQLRARHWIDSIAAAARETMQGSKGLTS